MFVTNSTLDKSATFEQSPSSIPALAKTWTLADFARFSDDPSRPRLTPEECDSFLADIMDARVEVASEPERPWG